MLYPEDVIIKSKEKQKKDLFYLDLFAGAGGLSEGFMRAGFKPIAHVELDKAACFTLKTRAVFHYLSSDNNLSIYKSYLQGQIDRKELYQHVPAELLNTVIHEEISESFMDNIFSRIDILADRKDIDLIIGGPPCQAYSLIGRARDANRMKDDKRNYLYTYYASFLERYKPKYFVFENVLGLLSAKDRDGRLFFDDMKDTFRNAGYSLEKQVLNACDYGIPQNRRRVVLVGKRGDSTGFYPFPKQWTPDIYVKDVLSDLPSLYAGEGDYKQCILKNKYHPYLNEVGIRNDSIPVTGHISRPHRSQDLEIYRIAVESWNHNNSRLNYNHLPENLKTHKNRKSFTDRFKVVAGNLTSCHTVVAHASQDGHFYIHPDIDQNRSLTPRELARLQTFPDDYYFESVSGVPARTPMFKQIGNAVPVVLAQRIAEKLRENW